MDRRSFWYVAYTKPQSEVIARDNLMAQNFECYLPIIKVFNKRSKSISYSPLFKRWRIQVRSTIGVLSLVKFGSIIAKCTDLSLFYFF
jgi:hypothetical protein